MAQFCFRVLYTPYYDEVPLVEEGEIFGEINVLAQDAEEAFLKVKEEMIGEELELGEDEIEDEPKVLVPDREATMRTCTNVVFYGADPICEVELE